MKEFKGTPGPWEVAGPCCDAVGTEFDSTWYKAICRRPERTGGKLTDECNANMHLIAAAPELLEALQQLLYEYESIVTHEFNWSALEVDEDYIRAKSAIAKALGETK